MKKKSRKSFWKRQRKYVCLLALFFPFLFTGCFEVMKINVKKFIPLVSKERPSRPRQKRRVVLALDIPGSMGCVLSSTPSAKEAQQWGTHSCTFVPVSREHARYQLKAQAKKMPKQIGGLQLLDVHGSMYQVLRKRLAERFTHVTIYRRSSKTSAAPQVRLTLRFFQGRARFGEKITRVKLTVTPSAQAPPVVVLGEGKWNLAWSNMAWYLPVAILLMPVGTIVAISVLGALTHEAYARSFALAMDQAAIRLADRLAASPGALASSASPGKRPPHRQIVARARPAPSPRERPAPSPARRTTPAPSPARPAPSPSPARTPPRPPPIQQPPTKPPPHDRPRKVAVQPQRTAPVYQGPTRRERHVAWLVVALTAGAAGVGTGIWGAALTGNAVEAAQNNKRHIFDELKTNQQILYGITGGLGAVTVGGIILYLFTGKDVPLKKQKTSLFVPGNRRWAHP